MKLEQLDTAESISVGGEAIPFIGKGNIWVRNSTPDISSSGLVQFLMAEALARTYPGQIEITVFDEGLAGIAAPFASANKGGQKIVHSIRDVQELQLQLNFLREHIHGVNNVVQGLERDLHDFRSSTGFPIEGYKLIVLSTDVALLPDDVQNELAVLLRAGPKAGVNFLVHSIQLNVEFLTNYARVLMADGNYVTDLSSGEDSFFHYYQASEIISICERMSLSLAQASAATVHFSEIEDTSKTWEKDSTEGLEFSIGRFGRTAVEISLGDELTQRHNILITGAVGQGKSNLISVILHSLCQRYGPSDVQLFLLDFKEGVTLQRFAPRESGEFLPHACVLGLEADREYGRNVLEYLHEIYRERMRIFKDNDVQDLRAYRRASNSNKMNRIVVVIDEFQVLFSDNDALAAEIADLLVSAVRLFRACGIHFILASQTIGGNLSLMGSAAEGLFGQVPIRIALKNSTAESHATLGIGNDAAAHLKAREAIINLDYGHYDSNQKINVAYADETLLSGLRDRWWRSMPTNTKPPSVFIGDQLADFRRLEAAVLNVNEEELYGRRISFAGESADVAGRPVGLTFEPTAGRNVAILGAGLGYDILYSIIYSLVKGAGKLRFILVDTSINKELSDRRLEVIFQMIQSQGGECRIIHSERFADELTEVHQEIRESSSPRQTFIVVPEMDRIRSIPVEFEYIFQQGPAAGIHVVGWWGKLSRFKSHVGYNGEEYFDMKIALQTDAQSVRQFMNDALLNWKPRVQRILMWDSTYMAVPATLIPYKLP